MNNTETKGPMSSAICLRSTLHQHWKLNAIMRMQIQCVNEIVKYLLVQLSLFMKSDNHFEYDDVHQRCHPCVAGIIQSNGVQSARKMKEKKKSLN